MKHGFPGSRLRERVEKKISWLPGLKQLKISTPQAAIRLPQRGEDFLKM